MLFVILNPSACKNTEICSTPIIWSVLNHWLTLLPVINMIKNPLNMKVQSYRTNATIAAYEACVDAYCLKIALRLGGTST